MIIIPVLQKTKFANMACFIIYFFFSFHNCILCICSFLFVYLCYSCAWSESGMTRNEFLMQVWDKQTMVGIIVTGGIVIEVAETGLILVYFDTVFSTIVLLLLCIISFVIQTIINGFWTKSKDIICQLSRS